MNILVTGGAGYVGGALTDLVGNTDHTVRVYDALLYEECYRKNHDVEFVYGDVRDTERLLPQLKWADAIIWLAALVGDGACALNPDISVAINQESVKWLCEHYDGRIVFLSTCSVYGAQDALLNEESPAAPLSVYGTTKLGAEQHLRGKNSIIYRLGTLFGVGDDFARIRFDLVVNVLTWRAYKLGKIMVFGGDQFRPLLHVKDAARMALEGAQGTRIGTYNLARQNVRISDLAYQIRNHFPDMVIEQTPMKFEDSRNYRVSWEKAANVLGFRAHYSIDEGIDQIKDLLESKRIKDVENPRYANTTFLKQFSPHLEVCR